METGLHSRRDLAEVFLLWYPFLHKHIVSDNTGITYMTMEYFRVLIGEIAALKPQKVFKVSHSLSLLGTQKLWAWLIELP